MVHTFHKVPHGAAPDKSAQDGIENMHIVNYVYRQASPAEIQTPIHRNWISRSSTPQAACVIAQQYPSATFASLRFHCRKKNGTHLKDCLF
jgi:hypothetical protein